MFGKENRPSKTIKECGNPILGRDCAIFIERNKEKHHGGGTCLRSGSLQAIQRNPTILRSVSHSISDGTAVLKSPPISHLQIRVSEPQTALWCSFLFVNVTFYLLSQPKEGRFLAFDLEGKPKGSHPLWGSWHTLRQTHLEQLQMGFCLMG